VPVTCNIDRKGRLLRGIGGVLAATGGTAWLVLGWPPAWWEALLAVGLVLLGGFMILEARLSWCVVRALGFRTPI